MRRNWSGILLACALFLSALGASAQGSRKQDIVFNRFGQPVSGATITVCTAGATGTPCSPLAAIYSNVGLTTSQANPFSTDGLGNYNFYAAPGRYQIQFSGAGLTTTTIPDVILPCDPSNCSASSINVTNGISAFSLSLSGNLAVSGSVTTGSLNPASISTPQGGAAPAQLGPHWYPGTATGVCTPPSVAPAVFVDATITGSLGTTTYYYKYTYINRNGETTASPTTTFAAGSGSSNAITMQTTDVNWATGCRGFRAYVSSDNVNFYLQTPFANAFQTTGHLVPGDAIFKTFTFSGTTPPVSNTATIDPLQVALNATTSADPGHPSTSTVSGVLQVNTKAVLTTPLVVSGLQKIQGPGKALQQDAFNGGMAGQIRCNWTDVAEPCVVIVGGSNGISMDGIEILSTGHVLGIIGTGAGWAYGNQNISFHNMSLRTTSNAGLYADVVLQCLCYNLDFDNVYMVGDRAVLLNQYSAGSYWKFKGSRWDLRKSAIVAVTGFVDRDRLVHYPGFQNGASWVTLEQLFTETGTSTIFDTVNMALILKQFSSADVGSANPFWKTGIDSFGLGANISPTQSVQDSTLGMSGETVTVQVVAASQGLTGIYISNSNLGGGSAGTIDRGGFNFPIWSVNSDLCLDPLSTNCSNQNKIINSPAGEGRTYGFASQGQKDGSGIWDYMSALGRHVLITPGQTYAKRRNIYIDRNTDNNLCISAQANDVETDCATAHVAIDAAGNFTALGTLTWNGGNKISKVLQAQAALTFGAIAAQTCGNQTVTLTGAATSNGGFASPNYAVEAGLSWSAFVSAGNTVTVRACNVTSGSITPAASSNWRVWVVQE